MIVKYAVMISLKFLSSIQSSETVIFKAIFVKLELLFWLLRFFIVFFKASLQKHLENNQLYEDSQDSGGDSSDDVPVNDCDDIIERTFGSYENKTGVDIRTKEALAQSIGTGSCLICISIIKRKDAIWSCIECHCVMHLQCIQRWAKDSIYQQRRDLENETADLSLRHNNDR